MNNYTIRLAEQAKDDIRTYKNSGNKAVVNKIILFLEELANQNR